MFVDNILISRKSNKNDISFLSKVIQPAVQAYLIIFFNTKGQKSSFSERKFKIANEIKQQLKNPCTIQYYMN